MSVSKDKCVLIVDGDLPLGVMANAVAVLSVNQGKLRPEMVGRDLPDRSGSIHQGITTMAIPVLKGVGPLLKEMRLRLKKYEPGLLVVDDRKTVTRLTGGLALLR